MASYVIHKAVDSDDGYFNGIKLTTPSDIEVSHTSTEVSIIIPKNTSMQLVSSGDYFNYNYCAFVVVVFKDKDGNVKFHTKANFNNDKANEDVYGFAAGDES